MYMDLAGTYERGYKNLVLYVGGGTYGCIPIHPGNPKISTTQMIFI